MLHEAHFKLIEELTACVWAYTQHWSISLIEACAINHTPRLISSSDSRFSYPMNGGGGRRYGGESTMLTAIWIDNIGALPQMITMQNKWLTLICGDLNEQYSQKWFASTHKEQEF